MSPMPDSAILYRFGDCELDPVRHELRRAGTVVDVQPRVFDCLLYLVANRERSVSKQELQERVWSGQVVTDAALTRAIMKARRAIGDDAESPAWIRTVHARGYRFVGAVEVLDGVAPAPPAAASWVPADMPKTSYTRSGEISIAYQVLGDGPIDLVYVPGWVSHLEYGWTQPRVARMFRRLASFSRLILFDKRGTGMSDRQWGYPTLEDRMDDVRAVMDAVGSERAAIFGMSEGGSMSALFAATHPERTHALILFGSYARRIRSDDYPWAPSQEDREAFIRSLADDWGNEDDARLRAPSLAGDAEFRRWWGAYLRMSASPGAAVNISRCNMGIDIRDVLGAVRTPTLVLHRARDERVRIEEARYLAARIPGARLVELSGEDHLIYAGDTAAALDEIESFLHEVRLGPAPDSVLATIVALDDAGQCHLEPLLARHRGRRLPEGSGSVLCAFDGPARALRFAFDAIAKSQGRARAGIHVGECEVRGDSLAGAAIGLSARMAGEAASGRVLTSSTLADLVSGAGFAFVEHGLLAPSRETPGCRVMQALR